MSNETYGPEWVSATIHVNKITGEMHSDGNHNVRHRIQNMIDQKKVGLNDLAKQVHEDAKSLGWYDPGKEKSDVESLMLTVSEISEAVEELRKPEPKEYYLENGKPEGYGVEIADAVIRLLDLCAYRGIDIDKCVEDKLCFNLTRGYRHGNKRY